MRCGTPGSKVVPDNGCLLRAAQASESALPLSRMLVHENVESSEAFDFLAQRLLNQIFGVQQHVVLVIFREILPYQHLLFTPMSTIGIQDCIPLERRRAWG